MLKVVDIVYYCHTDMDDPDLVLRKHQPTLGFIPFIGDGVDYTVIRHLNFQGTKIENGIRYAFFKRPNTPWQIPLATHKYIRQLRPDIVLIHGLVFPLQVIALRLLLGRRSAFIVQHHAEQPLRSVRLLLQKIADRCIQAYMFTAPDIAKPWLTAQVIRKQQKIKILPGASACVIKKDKALCKQLLGMKGHQNFLWVGRLNKNKDPITILLAFIVHLRNNPAAKLFMIYQTAELLEQVQKIIEAKDLPAGCIVLVGRVDADAIAAWYHAADFFISGSHAEAAGYALLEAMSAGCIPVVTAIPAYRQALQYGGPGFFFEPGNRNQLVHVFQATTTINIASASAATVKYFTEHLHFSKVAKGMHALFFRLAYQKGLIPAGRCRQYGA
jgi:glycosyltransferase involved in cell wall biosynthesis